MLTLKIKRHVKWAINQKINCKIINTIHGNIFMGMWVKHASNVSGQALLESAEIAVEVLSQMLMAGTEVLS